MKNLKYLLRYFAVVALSVSASVMAQEAGDDPVYELDPFEVSTVDDGSYLAKNAVSATRFDTPLKDIPISLQVMTESFLEDTFSLDLESSMNFAAAVNQSFDTSGNGSTRETGQFSIRGFRVLRVQRDGVRALYSQDLTNVSRVEVMKGPASLLYGQVQPGGIINYVPKRPLEKEQYKISLTGGSDGFFRAEIEATGTLIKDDEGNEKLLYRLDSSYEEEEGWIPAEWHQKRFLSPVLEWRFTPRAKLTFQYEHQEARRVSQYPRPIYSSFAQEQWLNAPDAFKDRFAEQTGTSGVMYLGDTGKIGPAVLVRRETVDGIERDYISLVTGSAITSANPSDTIEMYATYDPETDRYYLNNDPRFFVAVPEDARTKSAGSPVALVSDSLAPLPYDFDGTHPLDINRTEREFFSVNYQSPLPWENWHVRLYGVYDHPIQNVREGRALGLLTYPGSALRYEPYSINAQSQENKLLHGQFNITGKWEIKGIYNQTIIGGEIVHDRFRQFTVGSNANTGGIIYDPIFGEEFFPAGRIGNLAGIEPLVSPFDGLPLTTSIINHMRGFFVSNLSSLFQDKVKVLLGARKTISYTESYDNDPTWSRKSGRTPKADEVSPQYGLIYAPTESLSIFVSHAESFTPDRSSLARWDFDNKVETSVPAEPNIGEGQEIGVKLDLWESKLSGSIGLFTVKNDNLRYTESIPVNDDRNQDGVIDENDTFPEVYQGASEENSGVDVDLIYSPTSSAQFVISYAYIQSERTVGGEGNSFSGEVGVPEHQGSIWSRYRFNEGRFEGLSLGLGLFYTGERRLYAPNSTILGAGENVRIYADSFIKVDFQIGYEFPFMDNEVSFSLNIKNVTDQESFGPLGFASAPRQFYFTARYKF